MGLTSSSSCVTPYLPLGPGCWLAFAHLSPVGGVVFKNSRDRRTARSLGGSLGLRSARGPVGYIGPETGAGAGGGTGIGMMEDVEEV